jgi:N-acetylneuraminate lyase
MIMFEKTRGLIAAPPTPMRADGEVDLDRIEALAGFLARNGVLGAFVCGTTGEGLSLTVQERMDVVRRWVDVAGGSLRVIVHVGHTALRDAQALASHAAEVGAWGVGTTPSLFYPAGGVDGVADFLARIAPAAPDLPLYYYHIPLLTGVDLPVVELLSAAGGKVPNLAGVKYTSEDLMDYSLCRELDGGRFDCLFGRDEMLLSALAVGAEGAIGSTYNFAAPLYLRLIDAFGAGDLETAREIQGKSVAMIRAATRRGFGLAALKGMMQMVGMDVGPVRPPLQPLTAGRQDALRAELEQIGFFEFCSR